MVYNRLVRDAPDPTRFGRGEADRSICFWVMDLRKKLEGRYSTELIGEIMHISNDGEQFTIDYYTKKGGTWKRRMHYHDFYELEFILEGKAETVINSMRFELSRGMMFLVRPTDLHCYDIAFGEELKVCTLRFSSAMLDESIISLISGVRPIIAEFSEEYDFLCKYLSETMLEYRSRDSFSELIFAGTVQRLCVMLGRKCSLEAIYPSSNNRIAAAAADCINRRFFERLSIGRVASELGLSPNYLGKVFSEQMGLSFSEYLRRVRLTHALNRVISTDDTLQRIALESGFSSPSIFTREFKKYYKRSPSELRQPSSQ